MTALRAAVSYTTYESESTQPTYGPVSSATSRSALVPILTTCLPSARKTSAEGVVITNAASVWAKALIGWRTSMVVSP
jgi:hypothetical protein